MSGFSSGRGGPGSGGEGTVREGGSDEEEERLVSVRSLQPFFVSRWVRLDRVLLSESRPGSARGVQQTRVRSGSFRGLRVMVLEDGRSGKLLTAVPPR